MNFLSPADGYAGSPSFPTLGTLIPHQCAEFHAARRQRRGGEAQIDYDVAAIHRVDKGRKPLLEEFDFAGGYQLETGILHALFLSGQFTSGQSARCLVEAYATVPAAADGGSALTIDSPPVE